MVFFSLVYILPYTVSLIALFLTDPFAIDNTWSPFLPDAIGTYDYVVLVIMLPVDCCITLSLFTFCNVLILPSKCHD